MIDDPATVAPGFRHLTRQSLIFGLGALTGKATGLVLLPIFTRVLSPDDYGRLDVLWSLGSGMAGVLLLGLDAAAVRLYFDQPDVRGRGRLLATWAVLLGAIAAVATIALLATGPTIGGLLFGSASAAGAGLVLALVVPAALVNHYALTGLRTTGQPAAYAAFTVATFAVYAIGILALLGLGQASVRTIMVAWGATLTLTGVGGVLRLRNRLHGGTSRRLAVGLLKYGLPLAPILAVTLGSDFIHRTILLAAAGPAEVARLTVAIRFASVVTLAIVSFQLAWQPRVYAIGTSQLALSRIAIDSRRFVFGVTAVALIVAIASPIVVPIIAGESYRSSLPAMSWCLVAAVLAGVYAVVCTASSIAKRPADLTASAVVGVGVAIGANLVLAPTFGSAGTGASLAIGQLGAVIAIATVGRRRLPIPFPHARIGILVALTSIAIVIVALPGTDGWVRLLAVTAAAGALAIDPTTREILRVAHTHGRSGGRPRY